MVYFFNGTLLYIYIFLYVVLCLLFKFIGKKTITYIGFFTLFYIYLYFVIDKTQFPIYIDDTQREVMGGQNVWREMNLVPFSHGFNITSVLNIVLTIPLGIAIPFLIKPSFLKVFIIGLITGILLELGQLTSALYAGYTFRLVDIDDVIMNLLGAITGYLIIFKSFKLLYNFLKEKLSISPDGNPILLHIERSIN